MTNKKNKKNQPAKQGRGKSHNTCLQKYFGHIEITMDEVKNLLKNLLCSSVGELRRLEKSRELPACLLLLIGALFWDIDSGQFNVVSGIMDTVF